MCSAAGSAFVLLQISLCSLSVSACCEGNKGCDADADPMLTANEAAKYRSGNVLSTEKTAPGSFLFVDG